jgi:tRNA dimethylallyltransferase
LFEGPSADNEVRQELYRRLETEGAENLLEELNSVDPVSASKMLSSNTRRIIRALEVYQITGERISELHKVKPDFDFIPCKIGLLWERSKLYAMINERVDKMIQEGLVSEVERLQSMGYSAHLNALQTVGYKEVFEHLSGLISYDAMVASIKQNTRRFAKRQMTWFRADKQIRWFIIDERHDIRSMPDELKEYFLSFKPG